MKRHISSSNRSYLANRGGTHLKNKFFLGNCTISTLSLRLHGKGKRVYRHKWQSLLKICRGEPQYFEYAFDIGFTISGTYSGISIDIPRSLLIEFLEKSTIYDKWLENTLSPLVQKKLDILVKSVELEDNSSL